MSLDDDDDDDDHRVKEDEALGTFARVSSLFLTGTALVLQIVAILSCEFLERTWVDWTLFSSLQSTAGVGTLGLFEYRPIGRDHECIGYMDVLDIEHIKAARVFVIVSAVFGGLLLMTLIMEYVCCFHLYSSIVGGCAFAAATMFGALGFIILEDDLCYKSVWPDVSNMGTTHCTLGRGAIMNLVSVVFYFVSGLFVCVLPRTTPLWAKYKAARMAMNAEAEEDKVENGNYASVNKDQEAREAEEVAMEQAITGGA